MNGFFLQNPRLYVWELDIKWLSITVVDVVNITNNTDVFHHFLLSAPSQSNTRQSFAIKSDVNKRANACSEILQQQTLRKRRYHKSRSKPLYHLQKTRTQSIKALNIHAIRKIYRSGLIRSLSPHNFTRRFPAEQLAR